MKKAICIVILSAFLAVPAMADLYSTGPMTFGPGSATEPSLQGVLDSITTGPVPGDSSFDATQDALLDSVDSYWTITASGTGVSTMIVEWSAWDDKSALGVYDSSDPDNKVVIFDPADDPGISEGGVKYLAIEADGDVYVNLVYKATFDSTWFGFYFDTPDGVSYSDTDLNDDGLDHMVAYQGGNNATYTQDDVAFAGFAGTWTDNEFIFGWEDQLYTNGPSGSPWPGDGDYQDLVFMVESVKVPVPAAGLLALLGLSAAGVKLRRFA